MVSSHNRLRTRTGKRRNQLWEFNRHGPITRGQQRKAGLSKDGPYLRLFYPMREFEVEKKADDIMLVK